MTSTTAPASSPLDFLARHRALVAVLAAAAVMRLAGIGDWWLNPDEGIYYSILTRAEFGDFWLEVSDNAHPPLYYLLLRAIAVLTWDFLWFRLVSVVCGVLAVAGVWAAAAQLSRTAPAAGDRSSGGASRSAVHASVAGLVAGMILAFAPGAVELSQVMRPYMMLVALISWALFFLLRTLDGGVDRGAAATDRDLVAYLSLGCLALLTHYSAVFAFAVFGLLVLHDGIARGFTRPAWRRLALAHAVPATVLAGLWLLHLRVLSGSTLADEALDGWLRFYMIETPGDVWWSILGFQRLVALPWLRAPMALALVAAIGIAAATREARVAIVGGAPFLLAVGAAALGAYPLGATRHSAWLMAFAVPVVGWFVASLLDVEWGAEARARLAVLALPLLFGGPLGSLVGVQHAPWAPSDQVLLQEDLGEALAILDPSAQPELIVVSEQTFYLLMPFWPRERETAVFSPDGSAFHFAWGGRRVLASDAWDFTLRAEADTPGVHTVDGVFAVHLGRFLDNASNAFPELGLAAQDDALVVAGGWRPAFVGQLRLLDEQSPVIRTRHEVPGLYAFVVGLEPLGVALGIRTRPADAPPPQRDGNPPPP